MALVFVVAREALAGRLVGESESWGARHTIVLHGMRHLVGDGSR